MSDEETATEETEGAPNNSKKKLFIILIALNVVVLGGIGAFVLLGSSSSAAADMAEAEDPEEGADGEDAKKEDGESEDGEGAEDGDEKKEGKESSGGDGQLGPIELVGKFTINLADKTTSRYLRVVLKVEVTSDTTVEEVKNRNPQLRHIAIAYLSSLRLKDTQGPGALDRTRMEIERRFNHVLTTGEVTQVYFTDFVTQ